MASDVRIGVLGPLDVVVDAQPVELTSPTQRRLLLRLAVDAGQPVSVDQLADAIWGDDLPQNPANTVRYHIWKLRDALGGRDVIQTTPGGYRLADDVVTIDADRFTAIVGRMRTAGLPESGLAEIEAALELWRGPPYADARDDEFAQPEIRRLEEARVVGRESRATLMIEAGRTAEAIVELEGLIEEYPYHEALWSALMTALYREGRQTDALRAYQRARSVLGDDIGIEPSPELRELEQRVLVQDEGLRAAAATPTNLPVAVTSFLGRTHEMDEVMAAVRDRRLITIVGPGGSGKTRLAIESARNLVDEFPGGVWIVDLTRHHGGDDVFAVAGKAMGLSMVDPEVEPETEVVAFLRMHRSLLIIDNCEHMLDDVADASMRIIEHTSDGVILATSRAPLRTPGEVVYTIPELTLPPERPTWDAIADSTASALFVERAADVGAVLTHDGDTARLVARLCREVDGLPLAIELIASRSSTVSLPDLVSQVESHLSAYGERRGAGERHRTMNSTIQWSYDLMDAGEQQLLARLAVFIGGFTRESVMKVCAIEDPAGAVEGRLDELIERSMVEHLATGRYRLLEPVRLFGLEKLAEAGRLEPVRQAHAEAFSSIVVAESEARRGPNLIAVDTYLETEGANVRAALEWFETAGKWPELCRMVAALVPYWLDNLKFDERHRWAQVCAPYVDDVDDVAAASISCLIALDSETPASERSTATLTALDRLDASGDELLFADVVTVFVAQSDLTGFYDELDDGQGDALLRRAIEIYERHGDPWGLVDALNAMCIAHVIAEDPPIELLFQTAERARTVAAETGYDSGLATATTSMLRTHMAQHPDGTYDEATVMRLFAEAVEAAGRAANPSDEWEVRIHWAWHLARIGAREEAVSAFEDAVRLADAHGMLFGSVVGYTSLAYVLGEIDLAKALEALRIAIGRSLERRVLGQTVWVVEVGARLVEGAENPELAARLLGACEHYRRSSNGEMPSWDAPAYAETVRRIRAATGGSFDELKREGAGWPLSEAVDRLLAAIPGD